MKLDQNRMPIYEALCELKQNRMVPFDVPGHKRGRGNPILTDFLGKQCMEIDVNSMKCLDNLCHPSSVIKDAQMLAAEAFGADESFFIVNGTTAAVQAMIMSVTVAGDKIKDKAGNIIGKVTLQNCDQKIVCDGELCYYAPEFSDIKIGNCLVFTWKADNDKHGYKIDLNV